MSVREWTSITIAENNPEEYPYLIRMAEDGNYRAAQILMAEASVYLQYGHKIPEPLASYIGEALYRGALGADEIGLSNGGKKVSDAFNLKRPQSRNKYDETMKKHQICMEIELIRRFIVKKTEAPSVVADMYKYSDFGSVERIWKNRKKEWDLQKLSNSELEDMIKIYEKLNGLYPSIQRDNALSKYGVKAN